MPVGCQVPPAAVQTAGPPAGGQHYAVGVVFLFVTLVVQASLSLRGTARVLALLPGLAAAPGAVPAWTTGRGWLLRVGYYKLTRPKEQADDWVWFIDHSCQMGVLQCLVILGLRLRDLPPPGDCLRLEHLEPLEILPVPSSTQEDVAAQLTAVVARTGVPRAIVRDDSANLRGGVHLFQSQYLQTLDLYDIKHKTAAALRQLLEADERWGAFGRGVGTTKQEVRQTELAFLAPPRQRPKARYLNLGELLRWGVQTLALLDQPTDAVLRHVAAERLEAKLGWLRLYRSALAEWAELLTVTTVVEDFVRRQGLYVGAGWDLAKRRPATLVYARARQLWKDLVKHVAGQTARIRVGERVPASTEALESCFGKFKQLEKEQNRSGLTGLVLGIGAVVSRLSQEVVQEALEHCPLKRVLRWCKEKLGRTVQAQRRAAYAAPRAQ